MQSNCIENYLYYENSLGKLYNGDALEVLKLLPDESVDCIVTSPPYWALRDYGVEGQIGLEESFYDYVERLRCVFKEIFRILKPEGTLWLNIADTYYGGGKGGKGKLYGKVPAANIGGNRFRKVRYPPKCLCMVPERLAIAMIEDGWILRNKIIWHKTNGIPESVKDRFTRSYEYIYFFTKSRKYYFKQQLEPVKESSIERLQRAYSNTSKYAVLDPNQNPLRGVYKRLCNKGEHPTSLKGKNKRDVWILPTAQFSAKKYRMDIDHFAVFPEEIPKICIDAGCPPEGVVLDPFMGSGTTAVVAMRMGRKWIGIELNPSYCELTKKRVEKLELPLLLGVER